MKAIVFHNEALFRYGIVSVLKNLSWFADVLSFENVNHLEVVQSEDRHKTGIVFIQTDPLTGDDCTVVSIRKQFGSIPIIIFLQDENITVQDPLVITMLRDISIDNFIHIIADLLAAAAGVKPAILKRKFLRSFDQHNKLVTLTAFSPRRQQVLSLIARGLTNKEIAKNLEIKEATVKANIQVIKKMLKVENRVEIATWYKRTTNHAV